MSRTRPLAYTAEWYAAGWDRTYKPQGRNGGAHGSRSRRRTCTDGPKGTPCETCKLAERLYKRQWRSDRSAA